MGKDIGQELKYHLFLQFELHEEDASVVVLLHQLPVLWHLLQVLLLLKVVDEVFEVVEEGADPVDPARSLREVSGNRGVVLLLLEEPRHPVHLRAKGGDHPCVFVHHPSDWQHLCQLLKPGRTWIQQPCEFDDTSVVEMNAELQMVVLLKTW